MAVNDYGPIFDAAAKEWNVDPALLRAMATQESGGNPGATSKAGAAGIMQFMPDTAKEIGITDPRDPAQAIYGGAKYMSQLLDKYKKPELALAAYNAGPGRVDAFLAGKGALPDETRGYVPAIAANYSKMTGAKAATAPAAPSAIPSDADFLKQTTAAPAASTGAMSDADFLAKTGAAPEAAQPAAPAPAPQATVAPASDASAFPNVAAVPGAIGSVASAALKGAQAGASGVQPSITPEGTNLLQRAGILPPANGNGTAIQNYINAPLINGITGVVDLARRGASALYGGVTSAIGQGITEAGGSSSAARDIPHMLEGLAGSPGDIQAPTIGQAVTGARMVGNKLMGVAGPAAGDMRGVPGAPQPVAAAAAPSPGMSGPPIPNSVGAAATAPELTNMTPAQVQAYRSTAEGQKLLEPQPVGVPDTNAYVPGVEPTLAQTEQSVNISRELKALNQNAPEVSAESKAIAANHNDARTQFFQSTAGSDVSIANAIAQRAEQAKADLAATWAKKTDANPQPVIDLASEIKASPDGRRPIVRSAVDSVVSELTDDNGNLITDPEQLYGVRKHIDDLMSKEAAADNPKSVRAAASLAQLKNTLDGVIEGSAPGFSDYLKNFQEASRPIEEMQILQKHENGLFNAQNQMQYSRVQKMMKDIVDSRSAPGINPYKSISDETMQNLWNLRDDLRRSASADELARAPGSDTMQNAGDTARYIGNMAVTGAVHGAANIVAPGVGSIGVNMVKNALAPIQAARTAKKATARGMSLLHPDRTANPLRNPLQDP